MQLDNIFDNLEENEILVEEFVEKKDEVQLLCRKIDMLLQQKNNVIVAIEGSSASGKTTLGRQLKEKFEGTVLHMDDFFLRPEQRTKERFTEPGGNVDRERFLEEVVIPLKKGKEIEYRRFDCSAFNLLPAIKILPSKLMVVEGAYSTHPAFKKYYDLSVFLDITPELQKERILKRNGSEKAERFFNEWIPMEQNYFEIFHIKEKCDIKISIV